MMMMILKSSTLKPIYRTFSSHQRCADYGRVRLRTGIRRIFWIRARIADLSSTKSCGLGRTRILILDWYFYKYFETYE